MDIRLLHIFRNTPLGRDTLLQSRYFCQQTGSVPVIYIPRHTKFLMYFDNDVVQVDLDSSYLTDPDSALRHARETFGEGDTAPTFFEPKYFTASTLPDVPVDFDFMCCPRTISDVSSKIGLGYIGSRVRRIVKSARFPVLITSTAFKPWHELAVFFGGSDNAVQALRLGMRLKRLTGMPLRVYTVCENRPRDFYAQAIRDAGLEKTFQSLVTEWRVFESGSFSDHLYEISPDSLLVVGAYGHGIVRDMLFGSKLEIIQSTLLNNMVVVGPEYMVRS